MRSFMACSSRPTAFTASMNSHTTSSGQCSSQSRPTMSVSRATSLPTNGTSATMNAPRVC